MNKHGAISIANVHVNLPGGRPGPTDVRKLIGKGFCSFFKQPADHEVFRYNGKPIDHTTELQVQLRTALKKLAYALENAGNVVPGDNPNIPSGYVYLMQLVAHDIVQSAGSLASIDDGRIALNNMRSAMLRLESIFGGGPEASPLLYDTGGATKADAPKSCLRLGPLDTTKAPICPFRDLARVDLSKATLDVQQRVESTQPSGDKPQTTHDAATLDKPKEQKPVPLPDVIVGDSRNDDHPILSQLTVVFHLLHNGLVKWTTDNISMDKYADNPAEAAIDRCYFARTATTLILRHILRDDVMRRLLHPEIYRLYCEPNPPAVFDFDDRVPLEFTHGVMRVFHAMLRMDYKFNDENQFNIAEILKENSASRPNEMPLPEEWAVAWSNFFDFGSKKATKPNMSPLIGPRYEPAISPVFKDIDGTTKPGLAYRDLLAAALAGSWSGPAMIERLASDKSAPGLAQLFRQAKDKEPDRQAALRSWLIQKNTANNTFEDDELSSLSKDPPLPLFLMVEAMADSNGERLGPLGSVILAAVIFGIMNRDRITPPGVDALQDQLRYLHRNVFGKTAKEYPFGKLGTMAELIQLVADLNKLTDAKPTFI